MMKKHNNGMVSALREPLPSENSGAPAKQIGEVVSKKKNVWRERMRAQSVGID